MATIRHKDPKSGTVYVYSSQNYWSKEEKKYKSHRKLIGKIDPDTGLVVPTGKVGRPPKHENAENLNQSDNTITKLENELIASRKIVTDLTMENERLKAIIHRITRFLNTELKEFDTP